MSAALTFVELPSPGRGNDAAEQAARLLLQGLNGTFNPPDQDIAETLRQEIDPRVSLAALTAESIVVGTGGLMFFENGSGIVAAIVNVAVEQKVRGRGVGSKIIAALEDRSRQIGAEEAFTRPIPGAAAFYEKLGYAQAARPYIRGMVHAKLLSRTWP